jgi:hypothetical protein
LRKKKEVAFEKAPQNFSAPEITVLETPSSPGQKFFGSFFQKRTAFLLGG